MSTIHDIPSGRRLLVFVDGAETATSQAAIRHAEKANWPADLQPTVVDVRRDRGLAQWYGIVTLPAVALTIDRMLIAIEHECTHDACERLMRCALDGAVSSDLGRV